MPALGGGPGAGARELAEDGGDGVRVLLAARVGLEDALLHALDLGADLALLVVEGDLEVLEGVDLDDAAFSGVSVVRARARRGHCVRVSWAAEKHEGRGRATGSFFFSWSLLSRTTSDGMMALAETRFGLTVLTAWPIDAARSRPFSIFEVSF